MSMQENIVMQNLTCSQNNINVSKGCNKHMHISISSQTKLKDVQINNVQYQPTKS